MKPGYERKAIIRTLSIPRNGYVQKIQIACLPVALAYWWPQKKDETP